MMLYMPSQITHLAVARCYIARHRGLPSAIKDEKRFLNGNVWPDLDPDKERSHCGVRTEKHDLVKRNLEKVNPEKFRQTHDLRDEFNQGQYLHLWVDCNYYNVLLRSYFAAVDKMQSSKDIYETTQRDNRYLQQKYQVSCQDTAYAQELAALNAAWDREHHQRFGYDYAYSFPYSLAELDEFIAEMASVTL